MQTTRLLLGSGLSLAVLLCSCGKTPEPPARYAQTLGDSVYGAPIDHPRSDVGILEDQTAYKSARMTAAATPGGGGGAGSPAIASADVSTAARELVNNLLDDLQSGEIEYVLAAFDQQQVELLRADDEFLYNTQAAYEYLARALGDAYGDSSVEQLNTDLRNLVTGTLSIDPIDANVATVTPNPLAAILGPKAAAAMTVARQGGEWKIRLENPLTTEDVAEIVQYHTKLQEALYALGDALANEEIDGREAVFAALLRAAQGQAAPSTDEDAEAGEEESPNESEISPEDEDFDPSKLPPPRPVGP